MITPQEVIDHERGCGWRKEGGLYLRAEGIGMPCGKLPIRLEVCPCCGTGIKPARGWTWFNPRPFVEPLPCASAQAVLAGALSHNPCNTCVLSTPPEKAGLLWIGEKFYPTPADWMKEADKLGVSRRISMVPKGFNVGETWVFAAHRKAIREEGADGEEKFVPAIFHVFRPNRIEYVTKGDESQEELEALAKRGITPVKVKRAEEPPDQPELPI